MIDPALRRRRRSGMPQLAMELMLIVYAAVSAVIILRTILVMLDVSDRIWIGSFVYGITGPVTRVLDKLPGAATVLAFGLSVSDLTLLAPVILFPLGLIATSGRNQ